MKRVFFTIFLILQGMLMGANIDSVKVSGKEVPLIFERSELLPIVSMQIVFKGGGSVNDGSLSGISKISSMILNEGTSELGSSAFAELLESRAIELRVSQGRETLAINLDSLKTEFGEGVALLKKLLKDPNIKEETLEKLKTKQLGAIKRKETDFDYIASIALDKNIFKGTPIANPSTGSEESIKKITLKDVQSFLNKAMVLENAIVIIGGDVDIKEAKKMVGEILALIPSGKELKVGFYEASKKSLEDIVIKKDTEQAYIYFGSAFNAKASDEDAYKAKVAAFILGSSGFGSRLMEEVRVKRGLAYSAYAKINLALSHSYFSGHLQTKLTSQSEAVSVVQDVIKDFVKNGVTQKELDGAKKFLLGSEPLRVETLSQRLSQGFSEYYMGKPIGYSKEELKKIDSLTLKELNEYIKNHNEINELTFSILTK